MSKLTQKQENFCRYYIETGIASEAYRRSYKAENMKPNTVNVKASELLRIGKILVRVRELQDEVQQRSNITVDQKRAWLQEVIERSLQHEAVMDNDGNPIGEYKYGAGEVVRAINELNKMDGDHAAQKIEQKTEHSFEDLLNQLR